MNELEILSESIELISHLQSRFEKDKFVGPGATALFNGYECLNGAKLHLKVQILAIEKKLRIEMARQTIRAAQCH